jgi:hypothetical protein
MVTRTTLRGERETRAIEHGLGDRVSHDGTRGALLHKANGALDRLLDRLHCGFVRVAGNDLSRDLNREHRKGVSEEAWCRPCIGDFGNRHGKA